MGTSKVGCHQHTIDHRPSFNKTFILLTPREPILTGAYCENYTLTTEVSVKMVETDLIDHSPSQPEAAPRIPTASNVVLIDNFDSFTWK